jgi:hypothetical protein
MQWVELRSKDGFKRIDFVLSNPGIPHTVFSGDIDKRLEAIFKDIFTN